MTTVEEIARDLSASLNTEDAFLNSVRWIDTRYREMVSRIRFRHLRNIGEVQIPAVYDTGTVDCTRDSTSVTGTSTLWNTTPGNGKQEYYYFRTSSAWYKIASITNDTTLVLTTAFSEDSVNDGTYSIVKRHIPLAADARWLGDFVLDRLRLPIAKRNIDYFDRIHPGRILGGAYPREYAVVGTDSNNYLTVEFYPPCEESEIVHYVYWNLPSTLSATSTIPPQIEAHTLREGALIDLMRFKMAQALERNQAEVAATWRNEYRAQETKWEKMIQEAARTDRSTDDDLTLILKYLKHSTNYHGITNAHDYVYSNWNPPLYLPLASNRGIV